MIKNNKIEEEILKKNGYYMIDDQLRKKLKDYLINESLNGKISKIFSWAEFCEIFLKTSFLIELSYKGLEFCLFKEKSKYYFYSEGNKETKPFSLKYESALELLENAKVNGKSLKELWGELDIV